MNKALLGKWVWRFGNERQAWWRELMVSKCGLGTSGWKLNWNLNSAGLSMWRWIVKASSDFWDYGYVDPGGGWVSFWDDTWVSGVSLRVSFPRVFAAADPSSFWLFQFAPSDFRLLWDIPLRFQLRRGALTEFGQLMELLDRGVANRISAGPPTLVWPLSTSSTFTVKSFNSKLRLQHFPGSLTVPISTIWSRCVPTKIQGFVWLCFLNRIMTIDNLKGRGFQMPNRCSLCFGQEESVSHIFRLCPFSSRVWRKLSSKLSCSGPFAAEVQDFISSWKGMNCVAPFELAKKVIIHSFFWFIWLERNNRIFRDSLESEVQVVFRIWLACGRWLKAFSLWSQQDFEKWMRQLNAT
ncbi:Putative ribonuclease H protein At1g65750 [Linum perenne]